MFHYQPLPAQKGITGNGRQRDIIGRDGDGTITVRDMVETQSSTTDAVVDVSKDTSAPVASDKDTQEQMLHEPVYGPVEDELFGKRVRKSYGSRAFWGTVVDAYVVGKGLFYKVSFDDGDVDILSVNEVQFDVKAAAQCAFEDTLANEPECEETTSTASPQSTTDTDSTSTTTYMEILRSKKTSLKRRRDSTSSNTSPSSDAANGQTATNPLGPWDIRLWSVRLFATVMEEDGYIRLQSFVPMPDGEKGELESTGRIQPGDALLAVQGRIVHGVMDHAQACDLIRALPRPLTLTFIRPPRDGTTITSATAMQVVRQTQMVASATVTAATTTQPEGGGGGGGVGSLASETDPKKARTSEEEHPASGPAVSQQPPPAPSSRASSPAPNAVGGPSRSNSRPPSPDVQLVDLTGMPATSSAFVPPSQQPCHPHLQPAFTVQGGQVYGAPSPTPPGSHHAAIFNAAQMPHPQHRHEPTAISNMNPNGGPTGQRGYVVSSQFPMQQAMHRHPSQQSTQGMAQQYHANGQPSQLSVYIPAQTADPSAQAAPPRDTTRATYYGTQAAVMQNLQRQHHHQQQQQQQQRPIANAGMMQQYGATMANGAHLHTAASHRPVGTSRYFAQPTRGGAAQALGPMSNNSANHHHLMVTSHSNIAARTSPRYHEGTAHRGSSAMANTTRQYPTSQQVYTQAMTAPAASRGSYGPSPPAVPSQQLQIQQQEISQRMVAMQSSALATHLLSEQHARDTATKEKERTPEMTLGDLVANMSQHVRRSDAGAAQRATDRMAASTSREASSGSSSTRSDAAPLVSSVEAEAAQVDKGDDETSFLRVSNDEDDAIASTGTSFLSLGETSFLDHLPEHISKPIASTLSARVRVQAAATPASAPAPRPQYLNKYASEDVVEVRITKSRLFLTLTTLGEHVSVSTFVRGEFNQVGEIEASGKVLTGDILVGVGSVEIAPNTHPSDVARIVGRQPRPYNAYFLRPSWEMLG